MSVNNNLKTDIKNFIDLLQNKDKFSCRQRKISYDSGGLSIIYSASEPESSVADRSSNHHSGELFNNISQQFNVQDYLTEIKKSVLSREQTNIIQRIERYIYQLHQSIIKNQQKLKILEQQFEQQRRITDEVLRALIKMQANQNQGLKNCQNLQKKCIKLEQEYQIIKQKNEGLQKILETNNKDLEFMKKLVFIANENYEKLQKKCEILERKQEQNLKQHRSSADLTSRSAITHKKSLFSPSISQRINISQHNGQFDQNYRKHLVKTMKNKNVR